MYSILATCFPLKRELQGKGLSKTNLTIWADSLQRWKYQFIGGKIPIFRHFIWTEATCDKKITLVLFMAGLKLPNDSGIVQSQSILEPSCCCQPSNLHTLAKMITISSCRDFSKRPSLNLALVALRAWRSTAAMIGCRIGVYVFERTLTNRGPGRLRLITRQGILVARLALSYHKDLSLLVNFGTIHFVFVLFVWSNMYCLS